MMEQGRSTKILEERMDKTIPVARGSMPMIVNRLIFSQCSAKRDNSCLSL